MHCDKSWPHCVGVSELNCFSGLSSAKGLGEDEYQLESVVINKSAFSHSTGLKQPYQSQ